MKRFRSGFTLVEVSLFLAITAAIFVGVAVGTQNSIFQQRYNDSVQSFAEFLRSVYSQVLNVQNENLGRSDKAIYGKIVVFGVDDSNENKIVSYNVIGDINSGIESNNMLELMASLGITTKNNGNSVGFEEDYKPKWGSQIQTTAGWSNENGGYTVFHGALLILRHPNSGTVNTYFTEKTDLVIDNPLNGFGKDNYRDFGFKKTDIDFCINPNGAGKTNLRRDVRIVKNARNSSGIEVIGDENDENDNGNRCRQ